MKFLRGSAIHAACLTPVCQSKRFNTLLENLGSFACVKAMFNYSPCQLVQIPQFLHLLPLEILYFIKKKGGFTKETALTK